MIKFTHMILEDKRIILYYHISIPNVYKNRECISYHFPDRLQNCRDNI